MRKFVPPQRSLSVQEQQPNIPCSVAKTFLTDIAYISICISLEILRKLVSRRCKAQVRNINVSDSDRDSRVKVSCLFMRGRLARKDLFDCISFHFRSSIQLLRRRTSIPRECQRCIFAGSEESLSRSTTVSFRSLQIATLSRE